MITSKISGKRLYVNAFSYNFSEYYASKRNTKYYQKDSKMFTGQLRAILKRQCQKEINLSLVDNI